MEFRKENLSKVINSSDNYTSPKRRIVNSLDKAQEFSQFLGYPVIVKGLTKGAYLCKNESDLRQNVQKISDIWNNGKIDCIIEEYITGKYINCILAIKDRKIVGFVEMEKIALDQNGATWFGKVKKTKELLPLGERLIKKNNFATSIIEIETIEKEDKYYVYEINPRSPAWTYAPCLLGLNLPNLVALEAGDKSKKIRFVKEEGFFGREVTDFVRKDIQGYEGKMDFYSKGVAYKSKELKYPSELLLDL